MTPADRTTDRRAPRVFRGRRRVPAGSPRSARISTAIAMSDHRQRGVAARRARTLPSACTRCTGARPTGRVTRRTGSGASPSPSVLPKSITGAGPRLIVGGQTRARLTFHLVGDAASVASVDVRLQSRVGSAAYGRRSRAEDLGLRDDFGGWFDPPATTIYRLSLVAAPAILATHTVKVVEQLHLASGARNLHLGHKLRLTPWESSRHGRFRVQRPAAHPLRLGAGRSAARSTRPSRCKPLARGHYLFRVVGPTAGVVVTQASRIVSVNVI